MKSIAALVVTLLLSALLSAQDEKPITVGFVENISVTEIDFVVKAKLDTGATTSSVNAVIIEENPPDAKLKDRYVIFSIKTKDGLSPPIRKKVVRWVKIKKKEGGFIRRPTVRMKFCIAGKMVEEEVNLADRDPFIYDLLIGRNMLKEGRLVVDSSLTFTAKPIPAVLKEKD
ncbi:MAG: ATP-dependent zinc protease family protein [Roseibacillus sp.]